MGLMFATGFSLWVALLSVLRGSTDFAKYRLNLGQIIALYFAGGAVAGAIVGVLRPYTKHLIGAMLVGFIAAIPAVALAYGAMESSPLSWSGSDWIVVLISSAFLGPMMGLIRWNQTRKPST
jgi:hypothetical protein